MKKTLGCMLTMTLLAALPFEAAAMESPVAVTVNGEEILQTELDTMVSTLSTRMTQYGIETTDEDVTEVIRSSALQELVDDRLLTQDMTQQGCYDISDEEKSAVKEAAQISWEDLSKQYENNSAALAEDQEDTELTAAERAENYLNENGYTLEYMENYYLNALASKKYEQWLMQDEPEITEQEVQEAYEQRVEQSREAYEKDVSAFETALANGQEVWYRPSGYRSILQIMLTADGEDDEAKLASVKEKTDDIYARLEKGEAFEDLIAAYGEDSSFENESFLETGYQVHQDSILWEEDFIQAAFGEDLGKIGDYSQPLVFGNHVHILYYLKDVPAGAVELSDSLASALKDDIYGERSDAKMEERLEQLKEEAQIVYAAAE